MTNKDKIFLFILLFIAGFIITWFILLKAYAWDNHKNHDKITICVCFKETEDIGYQEVNQCHSVTVTEEIAKQYLKTHPKTSYGGECREVTPTPTIVTPTPTSSPSATPTPTQAPCTSNCGNPPTFADTSYHPATCNGVFPDKPLLQGFQDNGGGSVTFSWWGVQADKYSIRYGYSLDQLIFGIPSIPNTSTAVTLTGLQEGKNVWAVVTAYKGQCAIDSNPLDPVLK